jgi:hypothetical protein
MVPDFGVSGVFYKRIAAQCGIRIDRATEAGSRIVCRVAKHTNHSGHLQTRKATVVVPLSVCFPTLPSLKALARALGASR